MEAYKDNVKRDNFLKIDDPEVRAALDKIFEEGERDSLKGLGVPARAYIEELRTRLREGKPL